MNRIALALLLLASLSADAQTIVTFGDSVTAMRGRTTVYSAILATELAFNGQDVKVINAGIGGNTTADGKTRLQRDVLEKKPDVVVVMFGINDSAVDVWKNPPATAPRVPLAEYRQNLTAIAQTLKAAGARVVLMTSNPLYWADATRKMYGQPPYRQDDPEGFDLVLRDYVQAVRETAQAEGVGLVDVHAAFKARAPRAAGESSLARDGMHPDDEGHRIIADLLIEHLAARDARFTRKRAVAP